MSRRQVVTFKQAETIMKHYTIKINDKKNNNFSFRNIFNNPSEDLDDLILSNMKKMNPYLNNDNTLDAMFIDAGLDIDDKIIISNRDYSYLLKDSFDTEFAKAAKFLAKYTPKKKYYTLYKSNDITFFEDEIQIGDTLIPLYMLESSKYYNTFTPATKNTIINIFISINR